MFPANFFSFLVDELARLAVWLTARALISRSAMPKHQMPLHQVRQQRIPLLALSLLFHQSAIKDKKARAVLAPA